MKKIREFLNPAKDDVYDILKNREEMECMSIYSQDGLTKPLIMWGCKLCKQRKSDFEIYNVMSEDGDVTFCAKHGFLMDFQTFRRKRAKLRSGNRAVFCKPMLKKEEGHD